MNPIKVFVSGLPGKMCAEVAEHISKSDDIELLPFAMTGPEMDSTCHIHTQEISLYGPSQLPTLIQKLDGLGEVIAVDYSHPTATDQNAQFFAKHKIPFVMGTTGGDYTQLEDIVQKAKLPCVIAPNMAVPIVALTAMLDWAGKNFPGCFSGYKLSVHESHQNGKADTSGTAKSLIHHFEKLGASFNESDLNLCRDPELQKSQWKIPEEHLKGHAYHTYDLNAEGSSFRLDHNVLGRSIYAEGTLHAIRFLHKNRKSFLGQSYNMMDVLTNLEKKNV